MYFDYITDEQLKRDVRELKVFKNIKYSTIAERLGIKYKSFSNWMNGQFSLSEDRKSQLRDIIKSYN